MDKVLVTGAGGFIGGHTVRHLAQAGDWKVLAATRDGLGGTRRVDLRDTAGLAGALEGVDAVVHCAVGDRAVTVDGTSTLLAAAAEAGIRRFVYISSVAVYGGASGLVAEDTATLPPNGQGYAAWKAAAEQACAAQTRMEVVRLRPAIVYGPGSKLWVDQLARRIQSGRWGTFGAAGEGLCNLVHVSDVASAIAAALRAPDAVGRALNVAGPEVTTWNGWFSRLAAAIGAPPLHLVTPGALRMRAYGSLPLKALARLWPGLGRAWLLGAPARSELALFSLRATYPTTAAWHAMEWTPAVAIEAGLVDTVAWLRGRGLAT